MSSLSNEATGFDIGAKIRGLRRMKKLRLKDVAITADCSESLLSKIETNKVQPSIRVLHRVAAALGTSIAALFSAEQTGDVVIIKPSDRPYVTTRDDESGGTIKIERLVPFGEDHFLDVNVHVVDPGTYSGGNITHVGEEAGVVLEGQLEIFIEEKRYTVSEGDSFYFRSELKHRYRNPGPSVCRVLWVVTPPSF